MRKVIIAVSFSFLFLPGCFSPSQEEIESQSRLEKIQIEKNELLQEGAALQVAINEWQEQYKAFIAVLNDEELTAYNDLINKTDLTSYAGIELFKRETRKILNDDSYEMLTFLSERKLEIDAYIQDLFSRANELVKEESSLKQRLAIAQYNRQEAMRALGESLQQSSYQMQQQMNWDQLNTTLMNMQLNSPRIRTNNFGQIIDNTGQTLQYGR